MTLKVVLVEVVVVVACEVLNLVRLTHLRKAVVHTNNVHIAAVQMVQ